MFEQTIIPGRQPAARLRELSADINDLERRIAAAKADPLAGEGELPTLETRLAGVRAEFKREMYALAMGRANGLMVPRGVQLRDVVSQEGPEVTLGQITRGLTIGDWSGVSHDVRAQLLSGGAAAAIPGSVTMGIIDMAREQSVVFRAGAQVMPLDSPTAKVARMVTAPGVEWKPEATDRVLTDGQWAFDAVEMASKTAWLYSEFTIEAVQDVVNLDETVNDHFARALALTFDEAGLAGDGVDKPIGIVNMGALEDRIIERNAVGEITNYTPFVRAIGAVKAAHYEPSSVLLTSGLWTELNCLTDLDGNPLGVPRAYQALDEYVSDFLPSDGGEDDDEHTAIVGDLSALVFGVRTSAQIETTQTSDVFKKGSVAIRGMIRFDSFLFRPSAIAVMRGITLPAAG